MKQKLGLGIVALALLGSLATGAWAKDSWLHIRVEEQGRHGETVRVNLPLQMVEALLPMIDTSAEGGDVRLANGRIYFDCNELRDIDFREVLEVLKDAQDAEYVRVEGYDESVRVAKEDGNLVIRVDDRHDQVRIQLKMDIVEALLKADEDELDLLAMIKALREHGEGELVSVESEDEKVRIWIDEDSGSEDDWEDE